jgi:hypothetical protein
MPMLFEEWYSDKGGRCYYSFKKEFKDRYNSWSSYRDQKIIRNDFDGRTKASPYLISIFYAFDKFPG